MTSRITQTVDKNFVSFGVNFSANLPAGQVAGELDPATVNRWRPRNDSRERR
ncbi:hypothetical protein VM1G_09839 [Cytospora mali]|uniref:Uncharacterized protein n=1 Tax=Cytospora mali TaxID=578113 RepID=A0A194WDC4_CYTMA|nr:hypothetical protein VM1G_09839 [Valsa mali]